MNSTKELKKKIELCKKYKKEIIDYFNDLNKKYQESSVSYEYLKQKYSNLDGKSAEEWIQHYDEYISNYQKQISQKKAIISISFFVLLLIGFSYVLIQPATFIGLLQLGEQEIRYTEILNLTVNESLEYNLTLKGIPSSLKLTGSIIGNGTVKVYLDEYLVFDNLGAEKQGINLITILAVLNQTKEKKEENEEKEKKEENKTKKELTNETYENITEDINETLIEDTNITANITVGNATEDVSGQINETVNITKEVVQENIKVTYFEDLCIETCNLFDLNKKSFNLRIEIENATLNLSQVNYNVIEPINKTVTIDFKYKQGTLFDIDDNGIESIESIIDFTVETSQFNWIVNETNLCTRYEIHSKDSGESSFICYGSQRCCNFIDLEPILELWDDILNIYYGKHSATFNNTIKAQVLHVDYSLKLPNPYSEIYYSNWEELTAQFINETWIINETIPVINETLVINETQIINETLIPGISIKSVVKISIPATWYKTVIFKESDVREVKIPENAFNLTVDKIQNKVTTSIQDKVHVVLDDQDTRLIINDNARKVFVTYKTEAPMLNEFEIDNYNKQIKIDSSILYHNLTVYSFITPTIKENISFFNIVNGDKIESSNNPSLMVSYIDTNSDGLINKLQWIAPDTNQEYEISLNSKGIHKEKADLFIGATNVFAETNNPLFKSNANCNPETFCAKINHFPDLDDYEAEMSFDISSINQNINSAEICTYQFTGYNEKPAMNYIESLDSISCDSAPAIDEIDSNWYSALFNEFNAWQCINITSLLQEKVSQNENWLYIRQWGNDVQGNEENAFSCFKIFVDESECNENPTASDCRPYLKIKYE